LWAQKHIRSFEKNVHILQRKYIHGFKEYSLFFYIYEFLENILGFKKLLYFVKLSFVNKKLVLPPIHIIILQVGIL
jgi:hypothetical protein